MSKIRRIAVVLSLAAVSVIGACSDGVMPEVKQPTGGPAFDNLNLPPVPPVGGTLTTQEDSTPERCGGQVGSGGGRC